MKNVIFFVYNNMKNNHNENNRQYNKPEAQN